MSDNQIQDKASHHGGSENYDLISDPGRIDAALAEVYRHTVLISVRLDAEGPVYDSRVVRLDEASRALFLAQPEPTDPDQ